MSFHMLLSSSVFYADQRPNSSYDVKSRKQKGGKKTKGNGKPNENKNRIALSTAIVVRRGFAERRRFAELRENQIRHKR